MFLYDYMQNSGLEMFPVRCFPPAQKTYSITTMTHGEWKLLKTLRNVNQTWKNPNTFILTHCCDVVVGLGEMKTANFGVFCVRLAPLQNYIPFICHDHITREAVKLHVLRLAGKRGALWHGTIITHLSNHWPTFVVKFRRSPCTRVLSLKNRKDTVSSKVSKPIICCNRYHVCNN